MKNTVEILNNLEEQLQNFSCGFKPEVSFAINYSDFFEKNKGNPVRMPNNKYVIIL